MGFLNNMINTYCVDYKENSEQDKQTNHNSSHTSLSFLIINKYLDTYIGKTLSTFAILSP
jgi:hypothetical protein